MYANLVTWADFQVTVIAQQRGDHLVSYRTKSGDALEILYPGELSAEVRVNYQYREDQGKNSLI